MVGRYFLAHPRVSSLHLNSGGGDVMEAARIGELVRALRLIVAVDEPGTCASACFFIWMNGAARFAGDFEAQTEGRRGAVGLHRPYLVNPSNEESSLQTQANLIRGVTSYLESSLIPRRLIDEMMSRPSSDIYWLTLDDLSEMGESPPALEELYLSACGANTRHNIEETLAAAMNNDEAEVARLEGVYESSIKCTGKLNDAAHDAAIKRLAGGWMPSLPFKIKR
jgi:hypothetical protein